MKIVQFQLISRSNVIFVGLTNFALFCHLSQVECKKAQPKEVMLPANLAKTRAAGRTAYGELVVLNAGPSTATAVGAPTTSLRYAPYPLPTSITNQQSHHHHQHQTAHIIPFATPNPSILQYTTPQQTLYDAAAVLSYKRLLAATAAASLRPNPHHPAHAAAAAAAAAAPRATSAAAAAAALSYPLSELLGLQGIDVPTLYGLPTAALGL